MSLVSIDVYSGWELYDDFESGVIDTLKWDIHDSSATISIENGQAKFVHQTGNPNDYSWLTIKKNLYDVASDKQGIKSVSAQLH